MKNFKYESVAILNKKGAVIMFISGNSKAELIRQAKANYSLRGSGLVTIDNENFTRKIIL